MMEEQNIFDELCGCELCHQAPPDRTENPRSRLCRRCREQAIRYPVPWLFLPVALVILILTVLAYIRMPQSLSDYRIYATAEDGSGRACSMTPSRSWKRLPGDIQIPRTWQSVW